MLDFGWAELLVIGIVALIVIGPEDLPDMFRQLGRFTAKLRRMSREFSRAMEQAAKDSGVKDVVRDLKATTSAKSLGLDAVKSAADRFEKWDPIKNAAKPVGPAALGSAAAGAKPLVPPPMPASPNQVGPKPVIMDDMAEAEDDLAAHDEPEAKGLVAGGLVAKGPATQALHDKQALRVRVVAEQTAKLKAIEAGTYKPEPAILPPTASESTSSAGVTRAKPSAASVAKPAPKSRKTARKAETP